MDTGEGQSLLNQSERSSLTPRTPPKNIIPSSDNVVKHATNKTVSFHTSSGTLAGVLNKQRSEIASPMELGEGHSSHTTNALYYCNLEKENEDLREKVLQIEKIIKNMSNEIDALKIENLTLRKKLNSESSEKTNEPGTSGTYTYSTDEEELNRETNWILKKRKPSKKLKKRRAESSPEYEQGKQDDSAKADTVTHQQEKCKVKPPPPINVVGLTSHSEIRTLMEIVTDKEYKVTALNNDVWKINLSDSDTYRTLTRKLNTDGYQWFTYEDKNIRPIKVMARGLHPTCSSEDIIEDLKGKGFQILDAANIIKKERTETENGVTGITKRGLPLFMLTFNNTEKIENIYSIKGILNMRVKIEAMKRTTKQIPQCKKCQGFNHTQKYCGREVRCVKCAGKHHTNQCVIRKDTPPKCINCKGNHPANYRGCEVAKQLQKLRNRARNQPQGKINRPSMLKSTRLEEKSSRLTTPMPETYAEAVKSSKTAQAADNDELNVGKSIEILTARLNEQTNLNKLIFEQLKMLTSKTQTVHKNQR